MGVVILPFFDTSTVSAAIPAGYEKISDVVRYGSVGVSDPDGTDYIPLKKLAYATVTVPKKNNVAATSVVILDNDGKTIKTLTKVTDTSWQVGDITGTKVELKGADKSGEKQYFAWFRVPSGKFWAHDYDGKRYYVKSNNDAFPPASGDWTYSAAGVDPNGITSWNSTPSGGSNKVYVGRSLTIKDPLTEPLVSTSIPGKQFKLTQVESVEVDKDSLKYNRCEPSCMQTAKVDQSATKNVRVDDSNKASIPVTFEWMGTFDGNPPYEIKADDNNGRVVWWYNSWFIDIKATTYSYPKMAVYAKYDGTPPVQPDPGGSGGGGTVVFDPNDTKDKEGSIVRGWARRDFTVNASVENYQKAEQTTPVSWTKEVPCTPGPTGCTPNPPETGTASYYCWRDKEDTIQITGSFTGSNSVQINREGFQHKLYGKVDWQPYQWRWDSAPPSGATYSMPTCSLNPAPITGESEFYNLDKTSPVHTIGKTSQGWTNQPIVFDLNYSDNLSGFWGSGWDLKNISYYSPLGEDSYTLPDAETTPLNYSKTFTINQQGVYTLTTKLGDYAGWPEVQPGGPQTRFFSDYRYDAIPPYDTRYMTGTGGVNKNGTFDYIADYNNTVRISVGDELSGVVKTEFSWSKRPDRSEPSVNDWGGGWNDIPLTNPDYATGPNQFSEYVDVNINSKTVYNQNQATSFDDLKEGAWYLHIRQTDRAGNVTHSVSPQIWINKLKNLRINNIADFTWKNYFKNPDETDSNLKINGIPTNLFPMYYNKESKNISLGYGLEYKLDSVGFNDPGDHIDLEIKYHALDKNNNYLQDVDIWVENDDGVYIKLEDSKYALTADQFTYTPTQKIPYETIITHNQRLLPMYMREMRPQDYSTYNNRTFLPPTTKFVKKGSPLDLVNKKDIQDYKILVTYHITGYSAGHPTFNYTFMEDKWAIDKNWGQDTPNSYGYSRPSNLNMIGQGVNKGEVFLYDLQKTLLDDMKWFRTW
ncbi:hypothetical protein ABGV42_00125 [Paenibacillus pabuli]